MSRVNDHPKDNVHTYGMVTGLINCGLSLGATIGPFMGGVITDALGYVWFLTILSFGCLAMVSSINLYFKNK